MARLLVVILTSLLITACSDPHQTLLPENIDQWEADRDFQTAIGKLPLEEQEVLSTYLMRVTLEQLNGESIPEGLTIADALESQYLYIDEWQQEQALRKAEARALVKFREDYMGQKINVADFEVNEKSLRNGSKTHKVFCGTVINGGNRSLCDLEITIYMLDKKGFKLAERVYTPIKTLNEKNAEGEAFIFEPNKKFRFNYPIVENIPPNWNGMAKAEITKISFIEELAPVEN